MAMAASSLVLGNHISDKGPGTSKFSSDDQQILQQPYAVAVSEFGYSPQLIICAVRSLQKKDKSPEGIALMQEIDELESKGWSWPPQEAKNAPRNEDIGSDGESDGGSLEYYDANPPPAASVGGDLQTDSCPLPSNPTSNDSDDLQPDGEQPAMARKPMALENLSPKLAQKPIIPAHQEKDVTALRRKLHALRSENRRLKERQLCKSCHNRPVSITFLPCGHYSYCYDCGQRFSACPICRKTILADVRTFLA